MIEILRTVGTVLVTLLLAGIGLRVFPFKKPDRAKIKRKGNQRREFGDRQLERRRRIRRGQPASHPVQNSFATASTDKLEGARTLSVQLFTGEILESVRILTPREIEDVQRHTHYPVEQSLYVIDRNNSISMIREQNIKLVCWAIEGGECEAGTIQVSNVDASQNDPRDGWPKRRTIP